MPCNSDYMAPTGYETQISRVAYFLDELAGRPVQRPWLDGYHPRVYGGINRTLGDELVRELCTALQCVDVTQYSLEMQIWWRDHQAADKARHELELSQARTIAEREDVLSKLTPYERKVLGFPEITQVE